MPAQTTNSPTPVSTFMPRTCEIVLHLANERQHSYLAHEIVLHLADEMQHFLAYATASVQHPPQLCNDQCPQLDSSHIQSRLLNMHGIRTRNALDGAEVMLRVEAPHGSQAKVQPLQPPQEEKHPEAK